MDSFKDGIAGTAHRTVDRAKKVGGSIARFAKNTVNNENVKGFKGNITDKAHNVVDGAKKTGGSIAQFAKDTINGENNVLQGTKTAGLIVGGVLLVAGAAAIGVAFGKFPVLNNGFEEGDNPHHPEIALEPSILENTVKTFCREWYGIDDVFVNGNDIDVLLPSHSGKRKFEMSYHVDEETRDLVCTFNGYPNYPGLAWPYSFARRLEGVIKELPDDSSLSPDPA